MTTIVVTGTDTGVGKTWVTARLIEALRERGKAVAARKPVQSFDPHERPSDAEVLGAASGEDPHVVTPPHRWYEVPVAPPMAAEILGRPPLALDELLSELLPLPSATVLVEGVGGPRSPLAGDADTVGLATALGADAVLLVADSGLGAINRVLLAVAAFSARPVVFLNRFDPGDDLHRRNRRWLAEVEGLETHVDVLDLADKFARHPLEVR